MCLAESLSVVDVVSLYSPSFSFSFTLSLHVVVIYQRCSLVVFHSPSYSPFSRLASRRGRTVALVALFHYVQTDSTRYSLQRSTVGSGYEYYGIKRTTSLYPSRCFSSLGFPSLLLHIILYTDIYLYHEKGDRRRESVEKKFKQREKKWVS